MEIVNFEYLDAKGNVVRGEGAIVHSVLKKSPYKDHPGKHRFVSIVDTAGQTHRTWEWNTCRA